MLLYRTERDGRVLLNPILVAEKGVGFSAELANGIGEGETTVHWHGLHLDWRADGHPSRQVAPGTTYRIPGCYDAGMTAEEWTTAEHALRYLARADAYPHRAEGEGVLLEQVPGEARRILDLGTGDGRLLALLRLDRTKMFGVGLDFSEIMLEAARKRFAADERIELVKHDLAEPLPALGRFDAVVSSFAIHHLEHERKRALYNEVFDLLKPGGVFANLEHVASATHRLHLAFFAAIGEPIEDEDPSDRLLDVETQLGWLRELGLDDVDCYWKWLEMALLVGVKPTES
jgi:tRNA (cmo5U34)-methyltransferase